MHFPEGTLETINREQTGSYARMLRPRTKNRNNIEAYSVRDRSIENESDEPVITDWVVAEMNDREVTIKVRFSEPLQASSGEEPDYVYI